jgi:WD40 repeat protein
MTDEPDYYALLQVADDADLATIRLAFRRLARLYHPDLAGTGSLAKMQQLNAAYHTLSDPDLRQAYDVQRSPVSPLSNSSSSPSQSPPHPDQAGTLKHTGGPLQRLQSLPPTDSIPVAALSFAGGGALVGVGLLDGSIKVWDTRLPRIVQSFAFNNADGILQDLRLSPNGTLAMAWGFQLGIRVWNVSTGQSMWHIGASGPSGAMDASLFDNPSFWVRLALPDAPLTLYEEDPFRWAFEGRLGSEILNRPLGGPVDPAWAIPIRCPEVRQSRHTYYEGTELPWRVQQRVLSGDGRNLLTISTGRVERLPYARIFRIWELDSRRGARGAVAPRCLRQIEQPAEYLQYPLAVTPDLMLACASFQGRELRLFSLGRSAVHSEAIATGPIGDDAQLIFSPDGRYLAVASGTRLDLFGTEHGQLLQQWHMAAPITALACAPFTPKLLLGIALQNGLTELWGEARSS